MPVMACSRCLRGAIVRQHDEAVCLNCGVVIYEPGRAWDLASDMTVTRRSTAHRDTPHGTTTGYTKYDCRCKECSGAMSRYGRLHYRRRRASA